jgi:RNA polymerase sigma factor (sigma-70 family)
MASGQLNAVVRHLLRAVGPEPAGGLTDAQLLERFVRARDEAAFEVLVWRHGAMVLGTCRRLLRREQDAEDAFQATFLALVRKGASIGKREALGSWLYKVAYRVSLRARATAPVAPLPETPLPDASAAEPGDDLLRRELRAALDEEVRRLPEKYRAAFVLCQLESQTTEAAARALGCPPGTVGTRLSRARELLRRRLGRRGFGAPALLAAGAGAALPAALVGSTIQAALLGTAERAAAAGLISARVAALTEGALRTMSTTKVALAAAAVLAVGLLGGGAAFRARQADAGELKPAQPPAAERPTADAKRGPAVTLRWQFEEGRPFYQEVTTQTRQTMKIMDNDVLQQQTQTFHFRWEPVEKRGEGWVLKQKVEGVRLDLDIGGNKIAFDSAKEATTNNPLAEFYKALVGAELRVTLDREYKVEKVEGRDQLIEKLGAANPRLRHLLPQVLSEGTLRQTAWASFVALPRRRLRPGDSWAMTSLTDLGMGKWRTSYKYTYAGKQGKLDRIRVETTLDEQAAGDTPAFKIKRGQVKSNGTGTILFDGARGRVVSLELEQKLEGKLTVAAGDQDAPVELSQTQKITVRTTDTSPVQRAKARTEEDELERLRQENGHLRQENERLRRQLDAVREALRRDGKKE